MAKRGKEGQVCTMRYSFDGCKAVKEGDECPVYCPFKGLPSTVEAGNDAEARQKFEIGSLICRVCNKRPFSSFEVVSSS